MENLILAFSQFISQGWLFMFILVGLGANAIATIYGSFTNTSVTKKKSKADIASAEALKFKALAEAQASVFAAKEREKDFAYNVLIRELTAKANLSQNDVVDIVNKIHTDASTSSKDAARDIVSEILKSPDNVSVEDFQELMFSEEEEI